MKTAETTALTKNRIISELTKSPHGKLEEYLTIGLQADIEDADFFQHLICWNTKKGQIRDAKVALPVISLKRVNQKDYRENALANLAMLDPRNLVRAVKFARSIKVPASSMHRINDLITRYLRFREANFSKWERAALQHRKSMKELYVLGHVKPRAICGEILFDRKYAAGSVFAILGQLKNMSAMEAAGHIIERKIPFLIALGALGPKQKDPDVLMALIGRMSPTELVTNMSRLEKAGVKSTPALRAALEQALEKAAKGKGNNILKTSVAAEAVEDEVLVKKLVNLQEKQIAKQAGIEGDWLVLADKSGSMATAIEAGRHVAATLSKYVKGKVALVFFDSGPRQFDVTGRTYEQIVADTRAVRAGGGTSIGCGVRWAADAGLEFDGIAIVSDGGENVVPAFFDEYQKYCRKFDREPTIYFYRTKGERDTLSGSLQMARIDCQTFDLGETVDYYALPNMVQTMRVSRYSLVDEIMGFPLLTLDDVLPRKEETA